MPAPIRRDGLFIGVMSGTSLDGIDLAIARFEPTFELLGTHFEPFPEGLRETLLDLCSPGADELDRAGHAHRALGRAYADAIERLLERCPTLRGDVVAVGCHGQTVRHRPGASGFSIQLGSGDEIAARTGLTVVTDFRNRDMVLGGQGAPLVPAFHAAVFGRADCRQAVINIGGMANVTLLDGPVVSGGHDTGPGNVLLDLWYRRHHGGDCDRGGSWAASGQASPALLERLLAEPWFRLAPPKSTGRELFNALWLEACLHGDERPEDVQATLVELTATTLAEAVRTHGAARAWVCGGGAHNHQLMTRIAAHLDGVPVASTAGLGLDPDWVEACAFAWLARARLLGEPGNVPAVTGASRRAVLGVVHHP